MRLGGPVARRVVAALALLAMLLGISATLASLARAQVPGLPLPLPGSSASPEPEPTGAPPTFDQDPEPTPTSTPAPWPEPTWAPGETPPPDLPVDSAPGGVDVAAPPPTSAPAERPEPAAFGPAGVDPLAAALPGAFAVALAGLLSVTGVGSGILAMARRGHLVVRADDGGVNVEATKRWRLLGGLALLGAAATVGIVGWLKISLEPIVAVQLVYVASTGFAVLVLAIAGGSLVIAEQLRADEQRMREVEQALLGLAAQVQPLVSEPARVVSHSNGRRADDDITTEIG